MNIQFNESFDLLPIVRQYTKNLKLVGPNRSESRQVYCSGFYFALVVVMVYEEAGRPDVGNALWDYLVSYQSPQPSTDEFVKAIYNLSGKKMRIDSFCVPNPAFRYGMYGHLYTKGVRDCLDLCKDMVPYLIMQNTIGKNRSAVLNWINRQMGELNPIPETMKIKYVND